jgi:hypothetical protein
MKQGLPFRESHIFIAPYLHEDEVCMTVRQLQRHAIFMGKFTRFCFFFTRLRLVTLAISVMVFLIFMEFL